jgi:peptidoglycan/xylan/chitin deacetylase (PgdA/CDA1 family)
MGSEGPRAAALTTAALALGGLAVTHAGPGVTALGPVRRRLFPRLSGLGRADHVALTFDDGPDPAWTPAFLEVLADQQVRATFFMLGSMAAREPRLAAEVAGAGHEVAVHGWAHRYTVLRSPWAVADDLARARDAVAAATGAEPRFYRPPYGVLSAGALAAARRLGLTPVLWTCWGREWTPGATARSVWATLAGNLTGGATVLLHDSDCTSPPGSAAAGLGALPLLLEECAIRSLAAGRLAEHGLVS